MTTLINQFTEFDMSAAQPEGSDRDAAVKALETLIKDGNYAPGDRLPPERELIGLLGITRNVLRKALDTLEREGAIWRHVGKGTFVASRSRESTSGSLAEICRKLTPVKMMRARLSIEPAIAREAAINASSEAIAHLKQARDASQNARTWDEYEAQDDLFHRAIAQATDNILMLALFDQLNQVRRAVAWSTVVRQSEKPGEGHGSFQEHDDIIRAIEAHDPAAAHDAMRRHILSVSSRLFEEE